MTSTRSRIAMAMVAVASISLFACSSSTKDVFKGEGTKCECKWRDGETYNSMVGWWTDAEVAELEKQGLTPEDGFRVLCALEHGEDAVQAVDCAPGWTLPVSCLSVDDACIESDGNGGIADPDETGGSTSSPPDPG